MHASAGADETDLGRAAGALAAVQGEPQRAVDLADALLARDDLGVAERVGALWARGRALAEQDAAGEACAVLAGAAELADAADLPRLAGEVRVSRSVCLLTTGDAEGARAELALAEPWLEGGALGRLVMQRGLLSLHTGALSAARADFDRALPLVDAAEDHLARCRLLANRGVVLSLLGDLGAAEVDLERCQRLAVELDQHMVAAGAMHNLGYLRGRAGDVPDALVWFRRAREAYARIGDPARAAAVLETDLCGVLLTGGLLDDALDAAGRARRAAAATGNRLAEAEAAWMQARVHLARDETSEAEGIAAEAAAAFRVAGRAPYAALADLVALRAAAVRSTSPERLFSRAEQVLTELDEHGWATEADEVHTLAGELAAQLGEISAARAHLSRAGRHRRGPALIRTNAWLATARLRLLDGDRRGAKRALLAGMRVVGDHRASLGATELRTHATAHARELVTLGLRLATTHGSAAEVLAWSERWHAGALSLPPAVPPDDGRLAGLLTELRAVHGELTTAPADGRAVLEESQSRLESAIRDAARELAADGATAGDRFDHGRLRRLLGRGGRRVLLEYVQVDDHLWCIAATARRTWARDLGPLGGLSDDVATVRAAVRRLAAGQASERSLRAAADGLAAVGRRMEGVLVAPMGVPTDAEVVVVPTGDLQAFPWTVLPSLAGATLTVAPSATAWCRSASAEPRRSGTLLVAGPGLDHAESEVARLTELIAGTEVLGHPHATAEAVLGAFERVDVAHLATHGTFRPDSPTFSALELSDGPLTVHDLERLAQAPRLVVLPACDAGRARVHRGDELLGTASALLGLGVRAVVAPLAVVADDAVSDLMVDLHRALVAGTPPARALAGARRSALGRGRPGDVAAAHAMVVIGTAEADDDGPA